MRVVTIYRNDESGLNYAKYKGNYHPMIPANNKEEEISTAKLIADHIDSGMLYTCSLLEEGFVYLYRRYYV